MALDLHVLKDGQPAELIFQVEHYGRMAKAFDLFAKRTGIVIEPRKDTMLNSSLMPFMQALSDAMFMEEEPSARHDLEALIRVLKKAEAKQFSVGFFCERKRN